jgi:hypothetical protein
MTRLPERLAELRRHLDHLRELRPRVTGAEVLRRDLSLHNDVLFSLLTISQLVIGLAGELRPGAGCVSRTTPRRYATSLRFPSFPRHWSASSSGFPAFAMS